MSLSPARPELTAQELTQAEATARAQSAEPRAEAAAHAATPPEPPAATPPEPAAAPAGPDANAPGAEARSAYRGALEVAAWACDAAAAGEPIDFAPVRAAVRRLADVLSVPDPRLITLAALRDPGAFTASHAANVATLALAMGVRLELNRASLLRLGAAALLHDIGKAGVPAHVMRRSAPFGEAERRLLQRHTQLGAHLLLRTPGLPAEALDAARAAFEHHRHAAGGGYPAAEAAGRPGPLSRVIAVCDFFDSATAHRSRHPQPFSPRGGLERMVSRRDSMFDPVALHVLIETVGCYPPGTVVRLSDGCVAVVVSPGAADAERPWVVPVPAVPGKAVDPTLRNLAAADKNLVIEGVLKPWSVGVDEQAVLHAWVESWA